jgi:hypothetical protein
MKMRDLCLDWWEMGPNELDGLVKACSGLARLRVGITFPVVKLVRPNLHLKLMIGHDDATDFRVRLRNGRNDIYKSTTIQPRQCPHETQTRQYRR